MQLFHDHSLLIQASCSQHHVLVDMAIPVKKLILCSMFIYSFNMLILYTLFTGFSIARGNSEHGLSSNLACEKLDLVPSPLAYNGTDLPIIALLCNVTGSCHLDFVSLMKNMTSSIAASKYVITDVFFNCTESGHSFGKMSSSIAFSH